MLIQLKDGVPVGYPVVNENFYMLYPSISFPNPLTPDSVEPYGFGLYEYSQMPTPTTYEKVVEVPPVKNEAGIWMQTWDVVPMTPEEVTAENEKLRQQNKAMASQLLYQTDWTTISDVSDPAVSNPYLTNAAEFAAYRSQIRAIAVYPPVTVEVWPTMPTEQWSTTEGV